jgi:hypothetical protein
VNTGMDPNLRAANCRQLQLAEKESSLSEKCALAGRSCVSTLICDFLSRRILRSLAARRCALRLSRAPSQIGGDYHQVNELCRFRERGVFSRTELKSPVRTGILDLSNRERCRVASIFNRPVTRTPAGRPAHTMGAVGGARVAIRYGDYTILEQNWQMHKGRLVVIHRA